MLNEENILKKIDVSQLLLLFKMYKFDLGISFLLEKIES